MSWRFSFGLTSSRRDDFGSISWRLLEEGSLCCSANGMLRHQRGGAHHSRRDARVSLCIARFHAIMLMLHPCGERVTSLKHVTAVAVLVANGRPAPGFRKLQVKPIRTILQMLSPKPGYLSRRSTSSAAWLVDLSWALVRSVCKKRRSRSHART